MDPNDLISERKQRRKAKAEIGDDKQARFDLQAWKEFGRACGLHKSVIDQVSASTLEEGTSPWSKMQDLIGVDLPYTVAARRVGEYNLLAHFFRRDLRKSALLEAFADVCDMAAGEGKLPAMIFKFAGGRTGLPAAKLVITQCTPDWPYSSFICVPQVDELDTRPAVIVLYKDWLKLLQGMCRFDGG